MNINEEQAFDKAVENELIAFRKRQYSQTRNIPENNFHDGFNRGWEANTKWQEQQYANEAIAFADWLCENGWASSPPMWVNGEASVRYIGGKGTYTELTSKELYNIWQQTKKQ